MFELYQIGENSYYIESPAKIGLVKLNDTEVCLIDSGNDKDAGRKVRKLLEEHGWSLRAIYNTHSNADHVGGNHYLQQQTGCKIYAPAIESAFTKYPVLEPSFLYGGFPPKELRHKFLLAQASNAEEFTKENLPENLSVIDLPGHFFHMVGYRTSDDVVYLADCLFSEAILDKYQINFIYDVGAYLSTLKIVKHMQATKFVPAHAAVTDDVSALAQRNIDKVQEIAAQILAICQRPSPFERILQLLFTEYKLKMNFSQYALVGSTVRSYLAWLRDTERIAVSFEKNQLLWKAQAPV